MNPTEAEEQIEEAESSGNYSKEVIFDEKKYQKIISKNMKIESTEGFRKTFLDMFKRKKYPIFWN